MKSEHPVFQIRGFVAMTEPIREFGAALNACLSRNGSGLLCSGRSRYGKSSLLDLVAKNLGLSMAVFHQFVEEFDQAGTAPKFWRGFKLKVDHQELTVTSPFDSLLARIAIECDRLDTNRVVFVIDEAQGLSDAQWKMLKFLTENLIERKFHPFVLMFAQPEIKQTVDKFRRSRPDIYARFFSTQHEFRGLRKGEFKELLDHYDETFWPLKSTVNYTQALLPNLWVKGWRMSTQAPGLWDAFVQLARTLQVNDSHLEVAVESLTVSVILLILALQQEPRRDGTAALYEEVVKQSGFAELLQVQKSPEAMPTKNRGIRR